MDCFGILAAATETAAQTTGTEQGAFIQIDWIWQHITALNMIEALTFISFGIVCLFYGWRVFKVLVIISFTLLGAAGGMIISKKIGGVNNPLLAILLAIVMAIVSVPLMRWAVGILGAIAGAVLTGGLWYAGDLSQE